MSVRLVNSANIIQAPGFRGGNDANSYIANLNTQPYDSFEYSKEPKQDHTTRNWLIASSTLLAGIGFLMLGRKGKLGNKIKDFLNGNKNVPKTEPEIKPPTPENVKPTQEKSAQNSVTQTPSAQVKKMNSKKPVQTKSSAQEKVKPTDNSSKELELTQEKSVLENVVEPSPLPQPTKSQSKTHHKKTNPDKKNNSVNNTDLKLQQKLKDIYIEEIRAVQKKSSKPQVYDSLIENIQKGNVKEEDLYLSIIDSKYKRLRCADYKQVPFGVEKFTSQATKGVRVKVENGWHYRLAQNYHTPQVQYRISINANGSKELIQKLDRYVSEHCYYKAPMTAADWANRHDPITMYLSAKPSTEFLNALVKDLNAVNGIRSSEKVLIGKEIIPGVTLLDNPSQSAIEDLLKRCKQISSDFEKAANSQMRQNKDGTKSCSAGQFKAIEDLITQLAK